VSESDRRYRVALADDEPMGRLSLRKLLGRDPEVELVAECSNGEQVVQAVRQHAPEILFLDVHMPVMNGFEALEALEEEGLPVIVFATAFDRYAVEAFEVSAVDYLLKPFDDERFAKALERAKERVRQSGEDGQDLTALVRSYGETIGRQQAAEGGPLSKLTIHRGGRIEVVPTADILWIEAADQYVELHTRDAVVLMRESMGQLERSLDPKCFLRTHRSAIVALDQIRALERQSGGTGRVQVASGTWLPVSRSRFTTVKGHLG
jgi:two-component system LytT family response regulator